MRKPKFKNIAILGVTAVLSMAMVTPANANITYTCAGAKATIVSSKASITGTEGKDVIVLLGSTGQTVNAGAGDDTICGGKYNDVINGGSGNDTIYGNDGDDLISGSLGNDKAYGNNGVDRINGGEGNDLMYSGAGNDTVEGAAGNDTIYGDAGNDTLTGNAGDDKVYGGAGNDKLSGSIGKDTIKGDAGDDTIFGEDGNDLLYGGIGNDKVYGAKGNDRLLGDAGNDLLDGGVGDDKLNGNAGTNQIKGGTGVDQKTLGTKDVDLDPSSEDITGGGGGDSAPVDDTPVNVTVPAAMKTVLNNIKTFMDKAVTQKEITGNGWQNVAPDSTNNVFPSLDGATLTKVTWNLGSNTYCASIKKADVNYKVVVKNLNTTPVVTIGGGSCSDANKEILVHPILAAYFNAYTDYFGSALLSGDLSANGNTTIIPSTSAGTAPSFEMVKNVKWKTVLNTATNVSTTRLVLSGTVDGRNYFRNTVVFVDGVKTVSSTIAGIGSTGNLN